MRKLFLFICLTAFSISAWAISTPAPRMNASDVMIPIGKSGLKISLMDLSVLKVSELETLTGKKLKFSDKIAFKVAQRDLRKSINPDGSFNSKKLEKMMKKQGDGTTGFHIGGFALGFFLTVIGVLIAYLINDEKKKNRVKWAWIGALIAILLWVLIGAL